MEFLLFFIILATLIPFLNFRHWFFRVFDFLRMQILVLGFVGLLLYLIFGFSFDVYGFAITISCVLCLFYQFFKIFPYLPFAKKKSISCTKKNNNSNSLSLISANVFQENEQKNDFINLIQKNNPDVFISLESNKKWENIMDKAFANDYPFSIKVPKENMYGMHLYSKLKIIESEIDYLIEEDVPSIRSKIELINNKCVNLFVVHPKPPSPTENETSLERDAELIIVGKKVKQMDEPVIVCGDFNDVAWSLTTRLLKKIGNLIDPREGRGFYSTFHSKYFFFRFPIDHLFHSKHFCIKTMKRLPKFGSDHFALFYELVLAQENPKEKEPKLNGLEKQEVKTVLEEIE